MAINIATAMFGLCFAAGLISKYSLRCTVQFCTQLHVIRTDKFGSLKTELSVSFKTYIELFHVNFLHSYNLPLAVTDKLSYA